MKNLPLSLALLLGTPAVALPVVHAEPDSPAFRQLSFAAAGTKAAAEQKIVFVDFFTTWCGPCKLLDETTWQDSKVIVLLQAKSVALKIDAEKEKDLATRYKIEAYPTLLLLKPDGTELDRIVGYREPGKFIEEFTAGLAGKGATQRARDAVAAAPDLHAQVQARYQLGETYAQQGQLEAALAEYLWCFDEGMVKDPGYAAVRVSFLLSRISQLAKDFPPARTALEARRDKAAAAFQVGATDFGTIRDLGALKHALGEDDSVMTLFDQLPPNDPRRRGLGKTLMPQLLLARRYSDALLVQPYTDMTQMAAQMTASRPDDDRLPAEILAVQRRFKVRWFGEHLEILAGAGEPGQAREFLRRALAYDSSETAIATYRTHLERAGHGELINPPPAAPTPK